MGKTEKKLIDDKGNRLDGRKWDELRPIKLQVGLMKNADGSAYIEWGKNKIMAAVYGPKEVHPKHQVLPDRALLRCRYHMAPFSVDERKNPAPSRREIEISKVMREALEPAVVVEDYPRTAIEVWVEVLQSDGGSRVAGITAASLALADAGINMRDMVVGCSCGLIGGQVVADLDDTEDKEGDGDMPVAILPNLGLVSLLQVDGIYTRENFQKAFELAIEKGKQVYGMQRDALNERFFEGEAKAVQVEEGWEKVVDEELRRGDDKEGPVGAAAVDGEAPRRQGPGPAQRAEDRDRGHPQGQRVGQGHPGQHPGDRRGQDSDRDPVPRHP